MFSRERVRAGAREAQLRLKVTRWRAFSHTPASRTFGWERGQPVDRYYIEGFLDRFRAYPGYDAGSIRGRVLEIGGRDYAERFGEANGTSIQIDVLHENASHPDATIVGDLADPATLPDETFDCIICTQTLHALWDVRGAMVNLGNALRPGGTLLVTVPGISPAIYPDRDNWGDWWRFTAGSMARLADEALPGATVEVTTYGNLRSATAFLYGLATHELTRAELELHDPAFELIVALRAIKSPRGAA